jgi:1-acyl-sn-glycerol-3-phosphate acyltransferase
LPALEPWRRLTSPEFHHFERVPAEGAVLLVGNHTLMGLLDVPLLWGALLEERGRLLRCVGDHAHFAIPGWRDFVTAFGVIDGTRENCIELLECGEAVCVFPGGAREVTKRRHEVNTLVWGQRSGFAWVAAAAGAPIVPFAALGMDDAYKIVLDTDEILASRAGPMLRSLLGNRVDLIPPVLRGIGPTLLPRPEKIYFSFGEPLRAQGFEDDPAAAVAALREATALSIRQQMEALIDHRSRDPRRSYKARAARALNRWFKED